MTVPRPPELWIGGEQEGLARSDCVPARPSHANADSSHSSRCTLPTWCRRVGQRAPASRAAAARHCKLSAGLAGVMTTFDVTPLQPQQRSPLVPRPALSTSVSHLALLIYASHCCILLVQHVARLLLRLASASTHQQPPFILHSPFTNSLIMQMQRCNAQAGSVRASSTRRTAAVGVRAQAVAVSASTKVVVKEHGSVSLRGTVRKVNEDRYDVKVRGRSWCVDGGVNLQRSNTVALLRNDAAD